MTGPCMCGDTQCPSCGPAQGNWKCPICRSWADDCCEHMNDDCTDLKEEFKEQAEQIAADEAKFESLRDALDEASEIEKSLRLDGDPEARYCLDCGCSIPECLCRDEEEA